MSRQFNSNFTNTEGTRWILVSWRNDRRGKIEESNIHLPCTNSILLRSKEVSNFSQYKFQITFPVSSSQWTWLGYWQCSDVEKLEITRRVKWIKTVLMYLNLRHLCKNMSSRKWCAKFDLYWRGESENGMGPGGTKWKGPPLWCQGKVFSVFCCLFHDKRRKDISQE